MSLGSRALGRALVLVNWKGVFYERYLLDRHVTALEGDNGAGKTTVMIAAYLVLLPDLSKLRFTNLGETGATGGDRGIWGRLGDSSRPSFAALELVLGDGRALICGVHLERKSEPAIELTPFIISGLLPEARAHDFLLEADAEHDQVPTLAEVQAKAKAIGAEIQVFDTIKDYFSTLFELGITPLRLSQEEERAKYNDMLRTSMTGGISRVLTSELRSFVLRAQSELADTLGRMRANLTACRRTRIEVSESRDLEREIAGIYDAGFSMFGAAVAAARETARQARALVSATGEREARATAEFLAAESKWADASARSSTIESRRALAQEETELAQARLKQLEQAFALAERISELQSEVKTADHEFEQRRGARQAAALARSSAKQVRTDAHKAVSDSAQGLAELQAGLSELHRRAHAHRRVTEQWQRAHELLDLELVAPGEHAATWAREQRSALAVERTEIDRRLAGQSRTRAQLDMRRTEYQSARNALERLCNTSSLAEANEPAAGEYAAGRRALQHCHELEQRVQRISELANHVHELEQRERRWREARERALALRLGESECNGQALLRALQALEQSAAQHEQARREHEWEARAAALRVEELLLREGALEQQAARYQRLDAAAKRLIAASVVLPEAAPDLSAERRALEGREHAARVRTEQLTVELKQARTQVAELESHSAVSDPELLKIRDWVGGELLARRFEELEPEVARQVEAELGPLVNAIVVEDAARAAQSIANEPREVSEIWFVDGRAEIAPRALGRSAFAEAEQSAARDVVVETATGVRVTRVPEVAHLGRVAREQRALHLRRRVKARAESLEQEERTQHQLRALLADLSLLDNALAHYRAGDPESELRRVRAELVAAKSAQEKHEQSATSAATAAEAARTRAEPLRPLVPLAAVLDASDPAPELTEQRSALGAARAAEAELALVTEAQAQLAEHIEALRDVPPDETALAAWDAEQTRLEQRRDALFQADAALLEVEQHHLALYWHDAPRALESEAELVPELQAQHQALVEQAGAAELALELSEQEWEQATLELQNAQAAQGAAQALLDRTREELRAAGLSAPDGPTLEQAKAVCGARAAVQTAIEAEQRDLARSLALAEERTDRQREALERIRADLQAAREQAEPAEDAWRQLQSRVSALGLQLALPEAESLPNSSAALLALAASKRQLLVDRLSDSASGREFAAELTAEWDEGANADSTALATLAYAEAWQRVRVWLQRRLPAQVADVADPLQALMRLRDDLTRLEARLLQQEGELRGASEDVARSIDVQVRKATNQVRRLNQYLDGIQFGSIQAIRIKMGRVERMTQVLDALRDGSAQNLLFQSALPFEDALDEIFARYGGGRSGGQRILDYREYIELQVEVQRRTGSDWELANPTRVSTGEAIGVGAALMMVILTEWERDANLMRSKRSSGALRLLFLDEANRLSQDNLGVLFELCRSLDLQLLIAAPEVARAAGNTTYRLVRRVLADGQEEVVVSGRRSTLPEADAGELDRDLSGTQSIDAEAASISVELQPAESAPSEPKPPEQAELFG
ncbi:MAG TPA: chromosome partition protein MukB [Polyangiaceae bacterium]|nr:chromosome partition protein MukB [Polyangiaceae bacterium]